MSDTAGRVLRVGQVYRFGSPQSCPNDLEFVDGHQNWFFVTDSSSDTDRSLRPQPGIWNPRKVDTSAGSRTPLIICTSATYQVGTFETPWADVIRPDDGFAIYYGDNKDPQETQASAIRGNRELLDAMRLQHSPLRADRLKAPPILVLTGRGPSGPASGYRTVEGVAVVKSADVVLQRGSQTTGSSSVGTFQNIRFELVILELKHDGDALAMEWINARRNPEISDEDALLLAPRSWQQFVDSGITGIESLRRRVMHSALLDEELQRPEPGGPLEDILLRTISFFEHRRHDFETASARVVERIFVDQGLEYRTGWITQRSGDGGFDFVGRLDLDRSGMFPSTRQVVLGQAKCESSTTSGRDIARLAARLRRGWQGAYVTTSTFSRRVQTEVLEDRYPVLLVPGLRVASVLKDELDATGQRLEDYLSGLQHRYRELPRSSDPELVLLD
jgi:hypothetical protein